jgi:hypothetical protein
MGTRRITVVAVLAGLGLFATACGNQTTGTATSGSTTPTTGSSSSSSAASGTADPAKVAFVDDICGAVGKFLVPATSFKPDTSSPGAVLTSLRTQLGGLSTGLADAIKDLDGANTAGVPNGKEAVASLQKTFGQMKDTVDKSKAKMDAVNVNDTQAVATAVQDASTELSSLGENMQNPLDQPGLNSADMDAAAAKAPKCQQIKSAMGSAAPTTPTS